MERERKIYETFLSMAAKRAPCPRERLCYLQFYDGHLSAETPLVAMSAQDVLDCLSPEDVTVRWLLNQMRTFDPHTQKVVGLVFDRARVVSDVLWARRILDETR